MRKRTKHKTRRPRPTLKQPRIPPWTELKNAYRELMSRPNVVGCFVGERMRGGRQTGQLAVVCCVTEKVARADLDPRGELLPRHITWNRTSERHGRLLIDVQNAAAMARPASLRVAGAGDAVREIIDRGVRTESPGTLGIAVSHPVFGHVCLTAGHVVAPGLNGSFTFPADERPLVQLVNTISGPGDELFTGRALKVSMTDTSDYALVLPEDGFLSRNLYHDRLQLAGPFLPLPADLNREVFVLTRGAIRRTVFRGVLGTLVVEGRLMRNLLITDFDTRAGDSGSCLVDDEPRVWGMLVGFSIVNDRAVSVFMPALEPLIREQAEFL
jgi:hypothetical protein